MARTLELHWAQQCRFQLALPLLLPVKGNQYNISRRELKLTTLVRHMSSSWTPGPLERGSRTALSPQPRGMALVQTLFFRVRLSVSEAASIGLHRKNAF